MLGIMLDRKSKNSEEAEALKGRTSRLDASGYMTSLNSAASTLKQSVQISDIKKARALYQSVRKSNPGHPPAWIASARLEEYDGRLEGMMIGGCGYGGMWVQSV